MTERGRWAACALLGGVLGVLGAWPAGAQPQAESAARAALPAPPPAAAFFSPSRMLNAQLSPSGEHLAAMVNLGGRRVGLYVFEVRAPEKVTRAAQFDDADVRNFSWVNDKRLVFSVTDRRAAAGDQRFAAGLFSVRPDGSELRTLVDLTNPMLREAGVGRPPLRWNHVLLTVPRDNSDEVVVGRLDIDATGELGGVTPLRLNTGTRQTRTISQGAPDYALSWHFDADGEPRAAVSLRDGVQHVWWRGRGEDKWRELVQARVNELPYVPAFVDAQGQLYVSHTRPPRGDAVISRFDTSGKGLDPEPLIGARGFDADARPVRDLNSGQLMGLRLVTDAELTVWFDAGMRELQARVDQRFPGRVNRITCRRCGAPDMVAMVFSHSDREAGHWWIYRAADQHWLDLGRVRESTVEKQMAEVQFHRIQARDGHEVPVWLTIPASRRPGQKLPAIVLVHGGPWVRGGDWAWSAWEQFLASRGYLVINAEFRGSTGYGQAHFRAGWKQWGRAMQDDVADALLWAQQKGFAEPGRTCIAGASYGGYAALMGLVRHPELYRCGAAWVAVTDPRLLYQYDVRSDASEEWRRWGLPNLVGDPKADAARFDEVTPVLQAAKIKAPLLLAFGELDRRVPYEHGKGIRAALEAAGKPPQFVSYPLEGHNWMLDATKLDFATRLERFLAEHLR